MHQCPRFVGPSAVRAAAAARCHVMEWRQHLFLLSLAAVPAATLGKLPVMAVMLVASGEPGGRPSRALCCSGSWQQQQQQPHRAHCKVFEWRRCSAVNKNRRRRTGCGCCQRVGQHRPGCKQWHRVMCWGPQRAACCDQTGSAGCRRQRRAPRRLATVCGGSGCCVMLALLLHCPWCLHPLSSYLGDA